MAMMFARPVYNLEIKQLQPCNLTGYYALSLLNISESRQTSMAGYNKVSAGKVSAGQVVFE